VGERVHVESLALHPELVLTVSRWIYEEWHRTTGESLSDLAARTRSRMNLARIPLTLVAVGAAGRSDGEKRGSDPSRGACDVECVGTVGLWENDLESRPDLTPWLAALYVAPEHRGSGVGGALVEALVAAARGLGVPRLFLHTETASDYYRKKGWRFLFRTVNDRGEPTDVFDLGLG
jgi:GNAT superfamily N-acetyltransferase